MLKDKVCIVTGAGKGIGKAIVLALAIEGAIVFALEHHSGDVYSWADEFPIDAKITAIQVDVTDEEDIRNAVFEIRKSFGKIDVLVNNAGIEYNERIGMISNQHMEEMFRVNVFGMIGMLQYCSRLMIRNQGGSIINISSIVGEKGNPGQLVYSATKGAVIALTKSAAKELAPFGVRVNSIAPGVTKTEMIEKTDEEYLKKRISQICMGNMLEPQDIANACVFLASDMSKFISGQVIGVDGCTIM
ncbi:MULTISPECIES: SDR family NAD(P)-dependent oxidoreductase [Eubacterium]|uniref:3-oxoacyl-[acyl-carrier protein] reductase n=1 Tax=Eubacterium barkeri TaxID=1528 RepID=A0A1H3GGB9_EUBBA|nr:SDR family oxidoreductase [Eubacterium barkeri]SDY01688.1 3-oxoacyl-[acyl-carrier protein] reductase [Eubacterium barkeri]